MDNPITLTTAIRSVARAAGVGFAELARRTALNGDRIEAVLNGRRRANEVELEALCAALGTTPEKAVRAYEKVLVALDEMRDRR